VSDSSGSIIDSFFFTFWLSQEELDRIVDISRGSATTVCYLILLKWQEKNGGIATVKELVARFSEALEMEVLAIYFVKARSALDILNLELKKRKK
jgi:hypothetical protein